MSANLPLAAITATFRAQLTRALEASKLPPAATLLQTLVAFYQATPISGVDLTEADTDALLFEYGTYDWLDGRGARFTLGFTRQFQLTGDDEFYQLRGELAFAGALAPELPAVTSWSWDYPHLPAWQAAVQQTAGYQLALRNANARLEVSMEQT